MLAFSIDGAEPGGGPVLSGGSRPVLVCNFLVAGVCFDLLLFSLSNCFFLLLSFVATLFTLLNI